MFNLYRRFLPEIAKLLLYKQTHVKEAVHHIHPRDISRIRKKSKQMLPFAAQLAYLPCDAPLQHIFDA